jgi:hypothetical protein
LKCPPALVASGALQSPFSWIWNPCEPGVNPLISAMTLTPFASCLKMTFPWAVLPCVGASKAEACIGAGLGLALALSALAQAESKPVRANMVIGTSIFSIGKPPSRMESRCAKKIPEPGNAKTHCMIPYFTDARQKTDDARL